jgi:NADPH2:quinone reductase
VFLHPIPAAAEQAGVDAVGSAMRHGAPAVGEAAGLPVHHLPLDRTAQPAPPCSIGRAPGTSSST